MANVTAPQFQQDVNKASEWSNGDENTTVTMRLGQQADSPAKVIKRIDDLAAAQREDIYENATPYTVGNFTDGFTYTALNQRGEFGGDQYVFLGGLDGLPHVVAPATDPTVPPNDELYAKANYNDAASVANANGGNVQNQLDIKDGLTVSEAVNYAGIASLLGSRVWLTDRNAWFDVVLSSSFSGSGEGMDEITSTSNPNYGFKYPKTQVINVIHLGADPSGVIASDDMFNRAFSIAYTDATPLWGLSDPYSVSVYAPSGFYTFESGFHMVQTGAIRGDTLRIDFYGDGQFSTHLCSRGAPTDVLRIDGRYCSASKFAVLGSIDEIRDTDNSATYGINIINQRNGSLKEWRVAHVVGSGLRIGKSIVNHVSDGVVYRCGNNTLRAVEQTDPDQDGFQASTFKNINIEDSHGIGAFKFRSHRNSKFDAITFEQQPYYICELSSPSGQFLRDETLSFTNGATGFVALASSDSSSYINGNGEVVVRDLDESGGSLQVGDTVTSSGGATGVVKAFTNSGGEQFRTEGEFGEFDGIWLNQNRLRFTGNDFVLTGNDNKFGFVRLRDIHRNIAVNIIGDRNDFDVLSIQAGLSALSDEADYSDCVSITGANVEINHLRTENSKGVSVIGVRSTIKKLTQRQLYGKSFELVGSYSKIMDIDSQQAIYSDTGDLLTAPICSLSGQSTKLLSGVITASSARANDIITLSGAYSAAKDLEIQNTGICTNAVRSSSSGVNASIKDISVPSLNSGATGFRLVGEGSKLRDGNVSGGTTSVNISSTGSSAKGTSCSGYSGEAAFLGGTISAASLKDIECSSPNGATRDIFIATTVTNSIIKDNLISRGVNSIVDGGGSGNVISDNV